jgi:hypothetical protein
MRSCSHATQQPPCRQVAPLPACRLPLPQNTDRVYMRYLCECSGARFHSQLRLGLCSHVVVSTLASGNKKVAAARKHLRVLLEKGEHLSK